MSQIGPEFQKILAHLKVKDDGIEVVNVIQLLKDRGIVPSIRNIIDEVRDRIAVAQHFKEEVSVYIVRQKKG